MVIDEHDKCFPTDLNKMVNDCVQNSYKDNEERAEENMREFEILHE